MFQIFQYGLLKFGKHDILFFETNYEIYSAEKIAKKIYEEILPENKSLPSRVINIIFFVVYGVQFFDYHQSEFLKKYQKTGTTWIILVVLLEQYCSMSAVNAFLSVIKSKTDSNTNWFQFFYRINDSMKPCNRWNSRKNLGLIIFSRIIVFFQYEFWNFFRRKTDIRNYETNAKYLYKHVHHQKEFLKPLINISEYNNR